MEPASSALAVEAPSCREELSQAGLAVGSEHGRCGKEQLRRGECVAQRVVTAVLGQAEVGAGSTEPHVCLDERSAAPGDEEPGQKVRIDEPRGLVGRGTKPASEEGLLDLGDVGDEDTVAQHVRQLGGDGVGRGTRCGIHWADAMDDDGSGLRCHAGSNGSVVGASDGDASIVDRDHADGEHLVVVGIQTRRLHVDDGEGGASPPGHRRRPEGAATSWR